jgi:AcrR family transcriptional regulator
MNVRLSRAEQTARTRVALLDAARRVFLRAGYHGTSVEAIANEAGLTIGALYSRFEGKADLFLALLEQRMAERASQFADLSSDLSSNLSSDPAVHAIPVEAARRWAVVLRSDLDWSLLAIEFRVHAARHPEIAARDAALHEGAVAALAGNIAASLPAGVDAPPARVEELARAALAMSAGAALARAVEGERFSDELHEEMALALGTRFLGIAGR